MSAEATQIREAGAGSGVSVDASDVPAGYKRTEVGVIPDDWGTHPLRRCLKGPPNYGINAPAVPFDDGLPTYVRITDISEDHRFRPSPRVSVSHPNAAAFFLQDGDLVFARTGASVGKSYLYDPRDGPLVFAGFLIRVAPDPEEISPDLLAQYVRSKRYWDWVATNSTRSGQPGVNGQELGTLPIPLPPPPEQRAIAEALSDVDGLLGALEALIAKKRAIKQAAMQQLLTGTTRLPGFSGVWETRRLREIAELHRESTVPAASPTATFAHYSLPAFDELKRPVIEEGAAIGSTKFRVPRDAVLVSKLNPRIPRIWAPAAIGSNSVASTEFLVLTPRVHTSREYLFALCSSREFGEQMENSATGTTGSHQRISPPNALSIELRIPTDRAEQTAIATVLSDVDAEIASLARRRDKTQAIKRGMMQQLLTGRVRLVAPGAAA